MKKYLLIGVLLFVTFASKAQVSTDLFNIQTDGTIKVNNSSYLEPFYWESSYKLLPYKTYKIQSPDRKCQYDVILEYLGDNYYDFNFNSLKIIYNNQNICQVKNSNMWGPGNQVAAIPISSENAAFEQIPLSSTAFAIQTRKILYFWWAGILVGIMQFILGLIILTALPASALWVIGVLAGINFLIAGMVMISMYISTKYIYS